MTGNCSAPSETASTIARAEFAARGPWVPIVRRGHARTARLISFLPKTVFEFSYLSAGTEQIVVLERALPIIGFYWLWLGIRVHALDVGAGKGTFVIEAFNTLPSDQDPAEFRVTSPAVLTVGIDKTTAAPSLQVATKSNAGPMLRMQTARQPGHHIVGPHVRRAQRRAVREGVVTMRANQSKKPCGGDCDCEPCRSKGRSRAAGMTQSSGPRSNSTVSLDEWKRLCADAAGRNVGSTRAATHGSHGQHAHPSHPGPHGHRPGRPPGPGSRPDVAAVHGPAFGSLAPHAPARTDRRHPGPAALPATAHADSPLAAGWIRTRLPHRAATDPDRRAQSRAAPAGGWARRTAADRGPARPRSRALLEQPSSTRDHRATRATPCAPIHGSAERVLGVTRGATSGDRALGIRIIRALVAWSGVVR